MTTRRRPATTECRRSRRRHRDRPPPTAMATSVAGGVDAAADAAIARAARTKATRPQRPMASALSKATAMPLPRATTSTVKRCRAERITGRDERVQRRAAADRGDQSRSAAKPTQAPAEPSAGRVRSGRTAEPHRLSRSPRRRHAAARRCAKRRRPQLDRRAGLSPPPSPPAVRSVRRRSAAGRKPRPSADKPRRRGWWSLRG